MAQTVTTPDSGALRAPSRALAALTRAGTVAGPLFVVGSVVQAFARPGFDLRRHAISLLILGGPGWIQVINFVVTGLLVLAGAVGIRRLLRSGPGATWGPLLYGGYGAGLIVAAIFHPDPALGFPPGTPEGVAGSTSWHGALHDIAFLLLVVSLSAACFVFLRRFLALGRRGWACYCAASGVLPFPLVALGAAQGGSGLPLLGVAVVVSTAVALLPVGLLGLATDS